MNNRKVFKETQTVKHLTPIKGESSVLFAPLTTAVISTVRKLPSQDEALLNRSVETGEKVEQWRTKAKVIALSHGIPAQPPEQTVETLKPRLVLLLKTGNDF